MQVIGSGFGRTGTLSMKQALEELGFGPCYHMDEVFKRPSHARSWERVARGQLVDWEALFAGFGSAVDFPASVVWEELLDTFPDAKVIHTVRDPDRWYDSTVETIGRSYEFLPRWLGYVPPVARLFETPKVFVWERLFDGRLDDRAHAIAVYEAWTRRVVEVVPPEQLLVFDVAEGWEPLCRFLDVPVPDRPFPRVNDRRTMLRRLRALQAAGWVVPGAAAASVAFLAQRRLGTRTRTESVTAP